MSACPGRVAVCQWKEQSHGIWSLRFWQPPVIAELVLPPDAVNFTRKELVIICLLFAAVIAGGMVRLCRKGWTGPPVPPSIIEPAMPPFSPP